MEISVGLNIWLQAKEETVFCHGRALLLQGIKEQGSLRQAAKNLRMSYRAAWGKITKTQEILGFELITLTRSRPRRYGLTRRGQEVLSAYWSWRRRIDKLTALESEEFISLFKSLPQQ
ncbi:winged helix-turn-helix domain-containing protein [Desulfonatronovibrio hydrogenovorans]|uniref:winged helix-turn-helix domain-containing protein n=1 Tax=Desulfonatronovibrio hydrogenovorans TaxID=53245 RepID=UPI001377BD0C|nr:LysR family transcriptional regulator [Desulfonatronovibrio hydrogenovorans]